MSIGSAIDAAEQAGKKGRPIFDPVGTNSAIKAGLLPLSWQKIPIPEEFELGADVDFGKRGLLAEAQFSNYPFLLNNLLRSELFFKSRIPLTGEPAKLAVIITKADVSPALYLGIAGMAVCIVVVAYNTPATGPHAKPPTPGGTPTSAAPSDPS